VLPASNRLRQRAEFTSVLRGPGGARAGSSLLVVHARETGPRTGRPPRVGLVVPRAVGTAVVRNRTKRRLRALLAARLTGIPTGVDVVVRAQPAAAGATSAALRAELDRLLPRALARVGGPR
jgi:ribonuclease P protein component